MAKLSTKNVKHPSPPWMVNTTGFLAGIVAALTTMISTMPAGVPKGVHDWLEWGITGISLLAAVFAGATVFAKKSDLVGGRDKDDR
jgi:hypothetical protein